MAIKDWKKTTVDKYRTLWTKGKFVPGEGYSDWIQIDKTPGAINKYTADKYSVGAKRRINRETINGHFRFFKTRAGAFNFVKKYLNKY